MKRDREFDDILNECIERVLKGESVKSCLAAYPEHAAELELLLQTVVDTRKAAAVVPRPEFRQRAGYEFQAALRNIRPKQPVSFRWQVRLVTVLSIIVVVLMAGTGTVAAAGNSLPDEPLYSVKMATEEVRLALTPSALGKAELYAEFADKRVNEIVKMADKGNVAQLERVTVRMDKQLIAMANLNLPAREAAIAEDESPTALNAAPAAESASIPATASASGLAPAVTAPAVTPTPTPASPENKGQLSPSANFSSPRVAAQQEIKPVQAPEVATATALKPATAEKADKTAKKNEHEILETTVSQQAEKNAQQLENVKKRVPENVKKALEKAIEVAGKGYDEALKNIERKK